MKLISCLLFILLITGCTSPLNSLDRRFSSKATHWVFINANIIDVERGKVINNRDVYIEDGTIKKIDLHRLKTPAQFQAIDAENMYLSPGLIDSHVHLYSESDLLLYVANGITGVQNMWGFEGLITYLGMPNSLELKNRVSNGGFGPHIWTSGPILEGKIKTHPLMKRYMDIESAEKEVTRQFDLGYDFIKTYDWLSPEVFRAILNQANRLNMPVKGHIPYEVELDEAITLGIDGIEHLTGWIDIDSASINLPDDQLKNVALAMRNNKVSVCPSLLVFRRVMPTDQAKQELSRHAYRKYLSSIEQWMERQGAASMRKNVKISLMEYPQLIKQAQEKILQSLSANGVNIVACTDAGNPYVYAGISLHEEMALMQQTGLTPLQVLQSATINAALALGENDKRGKITENTIADLILTTENPLENIKNLNTIKGVMLRGKWFDITELQNAMGQ